MSGPPQKSPVQNGSNNARGSRECAWALKSKATCRRLLKRSRVIRSIGASDKPKGRGSPDVDADSSRSRRAGYEADSEPLNSGGSKERLGSEADASDKHSNRARKTSTLTGTLIEHGPAPYRFDAAASPSYFAKVETSLGQRLVWGSDLAEAIQRSQSQVRIGDEIGLRRVGRRAVNVTVMDRDAEGKVTPHPQVKQRTLWQVESTSWLASRDEIAHSFGRTDAVSRERESREPQVRDSVLALKAAELLAEQRLAGAQDRKRFVDGRGYAHA